MPGQVMGSFQCSCSQQHTYDDLAEKSGRGLISLFRLPASYRGKIRVQFRVIGLCRCLIGLNESWLSPRRHLVMVRPQ